MRGIVSTGLGDQGDSSYKPLLVVQVGCDLASPQENLVVIKEKGVKGGSLEGIVKSKSKMAEITWLVGWNGFIGEG